MKMRRLRALLIGLAIGLVLFPSARAELLDLIQPLLLPIQWLIGGVLALALATMIYGVAGAPRRRG